MLVEQIEREALLRPDASVLDVCSGSGVLAIAAARRAPGATVIAIDISRRAVIASRVNAVLNGVRLRALRGDLFEPVAGMRFDLIVSNPPYVPSLDSETPATGAARAWEGGSDGRTFIDRICAEAARHLRPGGALLLVHSSVCGVQATIDGLSAQGLRTEVAAHRRGPLGPLMRARAPWLHERGLLPDPETEELVVVRAQQELPVGTAALPQEPSRLRS
jgi:release factor glutamine methyltransferase